MRRRTLIQSPLEWQMAALPVPHPPIPVLAERGGTQIRAPLPAVIVDVREQIPFSFERFHGWFNRIERRPLPLGDYSVEGMEELCVVERKELPDLVRSFTVDRTDFVERLRKISRVPNRLLVITAALSQVKSKYRYSSADPNRITQSLIAALVGLQVPFVCTETHELGEEITASFLYQAHIYHWLETNGESRRLSDTDL